MIKNSLLLGFSSIFVSLINFCISSFFAQKLSPSEFGLIGLYASITSISVPVAGLCSFNLVGINAIKLNITEYRKFLHTYLVTCFLFSILILSAFVFVFLFNKKYLVIIILAGVFSLLRLAIEPFISEMIAVGHVQKLVIISWTDAITSILAAFVFVSILGSHWELRSIAACIASIFIVVIMREKIGIVLHPLNQSIHRFSLNQIMKFAIPSTFSIIPSWLLCNLDKIIVAKTLPLDALGKYTFAALLSTPIMTLNQSLTSTILPEIYIRLKAINKKTKVLKIFFAFSITITLISFLLFLAFLKYQTLFFHKKYENINLLFILYTCTYILNGIYRIPCLVCEYYEKISQKVIIFVISISLGFGSSFIICNDKFFLPAWGVFFSFLTLTIMITAYSFYLMSSNEK